MARYDVFDTQSKEYVYQGADEKQVRQKAFGLIEDRAKHLDDD